MKSTHRILLTTAAILAAVQVPAGVAVSTGEKKEKMIALRTADKTFVTASPESTLDCSGLKIGSKQTFTLVIVSGGDFGDGDEVKIRYTPNVNKVPDPTRASYWRQTPDGIKRGHEGDVFKLKRVEDKYAFQLSNRKFVGGPGDGGRLKIVEKQEDALAVEFVDVPTKAAKSSEKSSAPPATEKPATE